MLRLYSATPTLSMRVVYPPFEDARDRFDGIFYSIKAMLATDHYINIVFESKLDPTYMWHLFDVLSHEWFVHAPKVSQEKGRKTWFCPTSSHSPPLNCECLV